MTQNKIKPQTKETKPNEIDDDFETITSQKK